MFNDAWSALSDFSAVAAYGCIAMTDLQMLHAGP
jgi:hypothetical protein